MFDAEPTRVGEAINSVLAETRKLAAKPASDRELALAEQAYLARVSAAQSTNARLAETLATSYLQGQPNDYYVGLEARVRALRAEDVQRVAATYLRRERVRISVAGRGEQLLPQLAPFGRVEWF